MIFTYVFEFALFKNGWQEIWHVDVPDLATAITRGNNFRQVMRNIRAYEVIIEGFRCSQFVLGANPRVGQLIAWADRGTRPRSGPDNFSPIGLEAEDLVSTAANMLTTYTNNR